MFKIGVFVILCLCISNIRCVSEEMQEVIDMLHNTCRDESGTNEESIKKAQNGEFPDDQNLRCYTKCLMSEMSTISDDGIVDVDAAIAIIPEDVRAKAEPTIRKCGTQVGADPCDNAYLTFKCYYENDKENYFLP